MKKETKEVVTVKEVYIADDGTEFSFENDCIKYEKHIAQKKAEDELLAKSGIVDMTKEWCFFARMDYEKAFLIHYKGKQSNPCIAYAVSSLECFGKDKFNSIVETLENACLEDKEQNIVLCYDDCGFYCEYQGYINEMFATAESVKTKVEQLKTFWVA